MLRRAAMLRGFVLALVALAVLLVASAASAAFVPRRTAAFRAAPRDLTALGDYVLLAWNDLGMHCMNQYHSHFSVLPPYNNVYAQLVRRGDALHLPQLVTGGYSVDYSFPGNTYSVGKTDFWTYAPALFGVTLPNDVGLGGKGLAGSLDPFATYFSAVGIPLTPFPDTTPAVEHAYQEALLIARDGAGAEVARSTPVAPVSVELNCVSAGCHASEQAILDNHERVTGFDPAAQPILCAKCHADPALGTVGRSDAGYFSLRMHEAHTFMDQQATGTAVCYQCHPGHNTRCLRGVMGTRFGLVCQDCHGTMAQVASSIDGGGRIPWANEPACRNCHTTRFGEPVGQLYRQSTGHGGVRCEGCHNSTHAEWPSSVTPDNDNVLALQNVAGPLTNCFVCHGTFPAGAGPHDILASDVSSELLQDAAPMTVFPNPTRRACAIRFHGRPGSGGRLLVFDSQGRTVRLLHARGAGRGPWSADWDGLDGRGLRVGPGVYFVRWHDARGPAAARVTVVK